MEKTAVRELLIAECHRLLSEWQARQQRPWYGARNDWYDFDYLDDVEFSKEWSDWALLVSTMHFIDGFVDSMNHGFTHFDHRTWEDAVSELKEITAQLETGKLMEIRTMP